MTSSWIRAVSVAACSVLALLMPITLAAALDDPTATVQQQGTETAGSLSLSQTAALPTAPPAETAIGGPGAEIRYEYQSVEACGDATPDNNPGANCAAAASRCRFGVSGPGPQARIFRREVKATVPPGPWTLIGTTCYPDSVPNAKPQPRVTLAMVLAAFHNTQWASANISSEPKGNLTLVGLDTFFKVNWSDDGYQPDEVDAIDPVTMLGFRVEIRPRLDHFTYHFGDGQDFGPTSNEGGVYPGGGITHQYLKGGAYPANVETTFGADFRINGGDWAPIPDTVTVPGPATPVTVKTARAQLVAN